MSIEQIVADRHIEEMVHYTTGQGLLGMLRLQAIKSRQRLTDEELLEFILQINTPHVKDHGWEDYVNFSITDINTHLFGFSTRTWHRNADWRILAFDPQVMIHDGVYFATTNNIYSGVSRAEGTAGLDALFAPTVTRYARNVAQRTRDMPPQNTTCSQAEVLYPGELSTDYLLRIYAFSEEHQDEICGQIAATYHREIEIVVNPSKFDGFRG